MSGLILTPRPPGAFILCLVTMKVPTLLRHGLDTHLFVHNKAKPVAQSHCEVYS